MTPLLLLAEKVEGLSGPDREVDEKIGMAIGLKQTMRVGHELLGTDRIVPVRCPHYTASLDAAMSLVPEVCVLHALGQSQSPSDEKRPWLAMVVQRNASLSTGRTSYAATPALALVGASLRALAAMEAGE